MLYTVVEPLALFLLKDSKLRQYWRCEFGPTLKPATLEYEINVQVAINVQVGYFLQKNKGTGLNKRTGGNLDSTHILTFATIKGTQKYFIKNN